MNIKRASVDVKYEIDMFRGVADLISPEYNFTSRINNALIESFAIHLRNLYFFFYKGTKLRSNDDIIAEDYSINKEKFILGRVKKSSLDYLNKRVAKQVAHLTYHRLVYNKRTKPWKITEIRIKMDKTINAFIDSLTDEQKDWFK